MKGKKDRKGAVKPPTAVPARKQVLSDKPGKGQALCGCHGVHVPACPNFVAAPARDPVEEAVHMVALRAEKRAVHADRRADELTERMDDVGEKMAQVGQALTSMGGRLVALEARVAKLERVAVLESFKPPLLCTRPARPGVAATSGACGAGGRETPCTDVCRWDREWRG